MKDNFSKQAATYAKYRPDYPEELFDFLLQHTGKKKTAWDCATGNGQTAKELANYFEEVYATDISQKQLDSAEQAANIFYSVQPAEQTNFADNSFDLVTVSQAIHWFRFEEFYREVKRTGKNGSLIAAWMYSLLNITPEIDEIIFQFYKETMGPYWDKERKYVDDNYATIPFPFKEIKCPVFQIRHEWTIEELEGYLNTWSALQKFIVANDYNPVSGLIRQLEPFWKTRKMNIIFPLHIRLGRIDK